MGFSAACFATILGITPIHRSDTAGTGTTPPMNTMLIFVIRDFTK
jgi:hypothetical protein